MDEQVKQTIESQINDHKILIFMKGTREVPECGFSNQIVQIFKHLNCSFETVNVLADDALDDPWFVWGACAGLSSPLQSTASGACAARMNSMQGEPTGVGERRCLRQVRTHPEPCAAADVVEGGSDDGRLAEG